MKGDKSSLGALFLIQHCWCYFFIKSTKTTPFERSSVPFYDGKDTLTILRDDFPRGSRVLLCDDLLATGGTLAATIELVEKAGEDIVGIALLIELTELNGREKLRNVLIFSIFEF